MKPSRLLLTLSLLTSACESTGVPDWAMHLRSASFNPDATTEQVTRALMAELAHAEVPPQHMAPEQIASVAVREIEQDNQVDATLWLSIASYRYHQEARVAIVEGIAGESTLPPNVRRSAYQHLVEAEVDTLVAMGFHREVRRMAARAYGQNEAEQALQQQLTTLGKTTEVERESLRDALWQLQPAPAVLAHPTRYPALAEAFHKRLMLDARAAPDDHNPAIYLARIPIPAVQEDALAAVVGFFDPGVCMALASSFPSLRPTVVAKLAAARPETRANAAAALGLAPVAETRAALEKQLATESDPRVKLALAYALVHHGAKEQAVAISSALQSCQKKDCTLPVMLAQWLPTEVKVEIDPASVARIARGGEFEPQAHPFAAGLLRDIGRTKPLEEASVEALIVASRRRADFRDKEVAELAYPAIAAAEVLSREMVLARLATKPGVSPGPDQLSPGPLLARLARVAEAEDLPRLVMMMKRFGDTESPEAAVIVQAVQHIPGAAARERLASWMLTYPKVRSQILVGLVGTDFPAARLDQLVSQTDAGTILLLKALRKAPDLVPTLRGYLRNGRPQDQFAAAELAGIIGSSDVEVDLRELLRFRDARYYPKDAVLRHAAMQSLIQLALARTVKSAPAPAG